MRRRRPEKRQVLPDPVYNNILVTKFVNYVMVCGKKGVAEKIFYGAMKAIKQKTKTDGLRTAESFFCGLSSFLDISIKTLFIVF